MRRSMAALTIVVCALPPAGVRAGALDLIRPVIGPVTRHFEPPPTPYSAGHRGIDLSVPTGTTVVAAATGTVAFAGAVGGSISVSIDHAGGLRTTYSFLSAALVTKNQTVTQGQPIARSGPGASGEQPNLHFGLKHGDEYLDSEPYLVASMRANLWRIIRLAA